MANEFILYNTDGLQAIAGYVFEHFENSNNPLRFVGTEKNNGTLPMLKLWRLWMKDIAEFQRNRGAQMPIFAPYLSADGGLMNKVIGYRAFNENDAHEAYTTLCLGTDENGFRLSWAVNSDEYEGRKVASIGQKLHAMQKFHQFCLEKGIKITIPEQCEYRDLCDKQEQ